MKEYKKRIADKLLKYRLEEVGAVLVEGPKWCGKTTTAEQLAKSVLYMADPSTRNSSLEMADLNVRMLLKGDVPRLIDEWQVIPQIWDAIRFEVDHYGVVCTGVVRRHASYGNGSFCMDYNANNVALGVR